MQRVISTFLFGLLLLTSFAIALHAVGFQLGISGDPETRARFATMPVASTLHVLGGGTVLLIGGFQFSQRLRTRYTALHRNLGRIYLILVALGGTGSLFLAPTADGGLVAKIGFFMLGVLWLFSGWQAYAAIRRRDIQTHREWMMRSFAMTFAAVTLRVYLGLFAVLDVPFDEAYPVVAWLSWVPNLILVEWYLALKRTGSPKAA